MDSSFDALMSAYKGAQDTDGMMCYACDAAPKKPQTLQQHLQRYHKGQMPKGDCSWLKQYKKDHPNWKAEAEKVTKAEEDVDTVKKDAKGKSGTTVMHTVEGKQTDILGENTPATVITVPTYLKRAEAIAKEKGRDPKKCLLDKYKDKGTRELETLYTDMVARPSGWDKNAPGITEWLAMDKDSKLSDWLEEGKKKEDGDGKKKEVSKEVLERCDKKMSDEEVYALREMASDKNTPADVLKKLAFAEHYTSANANCEIQEAVANNPNTPNDILKHLSGFPHSNEDYKGKSYRNDVAESAKATLAAKKKGEKGNIPTSDYVKIRREVPRHVALGCKVGDEFVMYGDDAKEVSAFIDKDWDVEDDRVVLRIPENDIKDTALTLMKVGKWLGIVDKRKEPSKWCDYEVKALISSKDELDRIDHYDDED